MEKTNAMRMAEKAGIKYELFTYEVDENDLSGEHTAKELGLPPEQVFKTLVLKGDRTGYFVCCIPCCEELDLKKAAAAAGDKRCEMIPVKQLVEVTGYMRGGCSPIGMKKQFPTVIDETATLYDDIYISGGRIGTTIRLNPNDLAKVVNAKFADILA